MPNLELRIAYSDKGEEKEEKEEEKQELMLGLVYEVDGVFLSAKDKSGLNWYVAKITPKGTLVLVNSLPSDLFQTDEDGCIKIEKE